MSRQLEMYDEMRHEKRQKKVLEAVMGGLEAALQHAGGALTGLNIKMEEGDVLIVVKAVFPAGPMVGFVGAEDLPGALIKVTREARRDEIKWRADQWARK